MKQNTARTTGLSINSGVEGETIEMKVSRIVENKEPIKDGAPLIYTERKDGVQAGYNIKTDRFEVAIEGMDTVHKSIQAKRQNKAKSLEVSGAETLEGTNAEKAIII